MQTATIHVPVTDGVTNCRTYHPDGPGPWPAVIYYSDAFGITPGAEQMAERLASNGYFVLFPNLLYRAGNFAPFNMVTVWTDQAERSRLMSITLPAAKGAVPDTKAYLDFLAAQPAAKKGPIGAIGYCMGGRLALLAAETYPERFAAVACVHGGNLVNDQPDSAHRHVDKVKARIYFGIADNDAGCTPEHQAQLEAALKAAGVRYQMELYPGARHGFAVIGSHVFDAAAAEKHWERALKLFAETLK